MTARMYVGRDRTGAGVQDLIDGLVHEWCNRPHESCVCQSNPRRDGKVMPVSVSGRERQRLVEAARVILGESEHTGRAA